MSQNEQLDDFVDSLSHFLDGAVLEPLYQGLMAQNRPVVGMLSDQLSDMKSFRKIDLKLRFLKVVCAIMTVILLLNTFRLIIFRPNGLLLKVLVYLFVCSECARICFNCYLKVYITRSVDALSGINQVCTERF